MSNTANLLDLLLFAILPYISMALFFLVTIRRYRMEEFSYSSLSSQFLENRHHFWGLVPFHYGILVILFGHFIGFLIPRSVILWNSQPLRLYVLEIAALIFGLLTLVGIGSILIRRWTEPKIKKITSFSDWVLLAILLVQVSTGIYVAIFHGWGSSWFATIASPYLWSLLTLSPDITYVTAMPLFVKLHIIGAWLMIAWFPFTRLVHVLVVPNPYLWRKPQVVRWYGIKRYFIH